MEKLGYGGGYYGGWWIAKGKATRLTASFFVSKPCIQPLPYSLTLIKLLKSSSSELFQKPWRESWASCRFLWERGNSAEGRWQCVWGGGGGRRWGQGRKRERRRGNAGGVADFFHPSPNTTSITTPSHMGWLEMLNGPQNCGLGEAYPYLLGRSEKGTG